MGSQRWNVCRSFQAVGSGAAAELRGDRNSPWMDKHGVLKTSGYSLLSMRVSLRSGVFGVILKH